MPFYTPPGMANSLYLAMLRQQQQDMENDRARFDAQEDRRLNSMYQIADLQLKKQAQEQKHKRDMESLALQREAQYRQAQMEQGAATGREQMKQGVRVGIEEMKEGGRDRRKMLDLGMSQSRLDLDRERLERMKQLDPYRKALMQARTSLAGSAAGGFEQQDRINKILSGAINVKQNQLLKLMSKKPYQLSPQDKMAMETLKSDISNLQLSQSNAMRTGQVDYDNIQSILSGTAAPQTRDIAGTSPTSDLLPESMMQEFMKMEID